ncbi:MAG: glycosyltransferase [Patescibacteria group bacterium]|jgi:hypothetical protein
MISVIIVGYNSEKYLNDCLASIYTSTIKKFRVIFVDNNSNDDSVKFIQENFKEVIIIKSKENNGFAKGNNIGIQKAIELGSEYVFLINPDTIIDPNCIEILLNKSDPNTVLQPLILLHENGEKTNLINTSGGVLHYLGFSYCSDYRKNKNDVTEKDIAIASGAAVLVPTNILNKIGLFDELFFMYHEDVDLFWRARMYGYNIRLIPDALIWHKYSFSRNKDKMFYTERNRLLFLFKNFSLRYLLLILPIFVFNEIFILIYALLTGWLGYKIKSYISLIRLLPKEFEKRKQNKLVSNKSERKNKKFISSEISFSEFAIFLIQPYNYAINFYWKLIYSFI